ncbi:MAG: hypothetical protein NTZ42_03965 [Candidatus Gribaldobacteria bacterium]|nr:hypothetical protein [Candidatus Gribaldobacteria bacterium]
MTENFGENKLMQNRAAGIIIKDNKILLMRRVKGGREYFVFGRKEFYFLISDFSGEVELSGQEKQMMNKNNQYYPIWKTLDEFKGLTNFFPQQAKQNVEKLIGK